jgi:hypothetical protein
LAGPLAFGLAGRSAHQRAARRIALLARSRARRLGAAASDPYAEGRTGWTLAWLGLLIVAAAWRLNWQGIGLG